MRSQRRRPRPSGSGQVPASSVEAGHTWGDPAVDDDSARQGGATPTPSSRPIAVLSFFCGIGTTFLAVRDLGVSPVLSWCWELDEECKRVTSGHSPRVRHWGDALASDPQWTAQLLQAHGPTDTLVLVCASPPCTDFSQMRSQQPGLSGSEGCKFKEWVKWFQTFRSQLSRTNTSSSWRM